MGFISLIVSGCKGMKTNFHEQVDLEEENSFL